MSGIAGCPIHDGPIVMSGIAGCPIHERSHRHEWDRRHHPSPPSSREASRTARSTVTLESECPPRSSAPPARCKARSPSPATSPSPTATPMLAGLAEGTSRLRQLLHRSRPALLAGLHGIARRQRRAKRHAGAVEVTGVAGASASRPRRSTAATPAPPCACLAGLIAPASAHLYPHRRPLAHPPPDGAYP